MNKILFSLVALCLWSTGAANVAFSESSISTFHQVRNEAEDLRKEHINRQNFLLEEQYLSDVKLYQENAKSFLEENKLEHQKIKDNLHKLESFREANKKWFEQHEVLLNDYADYVDGAKHDGERVNLLQAAIGKLETSIAALEYAYESLNSKIKDLERSIGIVHDEVVDQAKLMEVEQAVLEALNKVGFDENRLEEADAIKQNIMNGGDGDIQRIAYDPVLVDRVQREIEANYRELTAWDVLLQKDYKLVENLYALMDAFEQRRDIAQELLETRKWQEELYAYDVELRKEIQELTKEQKKIEQVLEYKQFGKYAGMGLEFYSWDSSDGSKGHQFVMPLEYFESHGYNEYGFSTGLVNTVSKYPERETMNGMRALELHYGRRNPHDRYTVKYNFDMSIPLGESRTGKKALSDDLVSVTRLSEGFNLGPSIDIERRDGEENIWRAGAGYNFRGNYHYSKENPGFTVSPGDVLDGYLNWTHAEDDHQMRFGVEGVFNGKSNENGLRYREGEDRLYKAMYNKCLNDRADVMAYFWVRDSGSNTYYNAPFSGGSGSMVRYYGLEYKYKVDEQRAWFIRNNNMLSTGTYHDVLTGETINGRKKHTLGVGYEIKLGTDETLSLSADYFWMKDKDTEKDYDGAEFIVFYNRAI